MMDVMDVVVPRRTAVTTADLLNPADDTTDIVMRSAPLTLRKVWVHAQWLKSRDLDLRNMEEGTDESRNLLLRTEAHVAGLPYNALIHLCDSIGGTFLDGPGDSFFPDFSILQVPNITHAIARDEIHSCLSCPIHHRTSSPSTSSTTFSSSSSSSSSIIRTAGCPCMLPRGVCDHLPTRGASAFRVEPELDVVFGEAGLVCRGHRDVFWRSFYYGGTQAEQRCSVDDEKQALLTEPDDWEALTRLAMAYGDEDAVAPEVRGRLGQGRSIWSPDGNKVD